MAFQDQYHDEKDFLINFSLGAATNFGFSSFLEAEKNIGLQAPLEYRQELYFDKYALGECVSLLISYNKWDNVYFGGKFSYLHDASCNIVTTSNKDYNIKLQAMSATLQAIYKAEIPEDRRIGGVFEGGIGLSFSRVKNSEDVKYAIKEVEGEIDTLLHKNEDPSYEVGLCANFGFGLLYHIHLDTLSIGIKYEFDYLNIRREAFKQSSETFKSKFVTPFIHKISLGVYCSF